MLWLKSWLLGGFVKMVLRTEWSDPNTKDLGSYNFKFQTDPNLLSSHMFEFNRIETIFVLNYLDIGPLDI